jgi:hypothetical protein
MFRSGAVGHSRIKTKFLQYRQEQLLIDLRYSVGNQIYSAHKLLLARHSSFFRDLFNRLPPQGPNTPLDLEIPFDAFGKFVTFVDFLYAGYLRVADTDYESII